MVKKKAIEHFVTRLTQESFAFYKRERLFQLSKHFWGNVAAHALVGLAIGGVIVWIRGIEPMPVMLLTTSVCALWGTQKRFRKN
jgi:hypothetical protein